MNADDVRNWLGRYFLAITVAAGGYLLLFPGTVLLPGITPGEARSMFQTLIPVLVGQLTIIFRWFGGTAESVELLRPIPPWVVKGPPIATTGILVVAVALLIAEGNSPGGEGVIAAALPSVVTFGATIINATTMFVVARYFELAKR